jgi:signal transduction histidine kinase
MMSIPDTSRPSATESDVAPTPVIGTLRLVLAGAAIVTFLVDAEAVRRLPPFAWLIFFFFGLHNIVLYALAYRRHPASESRVVLWCDIAWYSAMVYVTGGGGSLFFPFYAFTMLISAFRFGFDESARITLTSAAMFSLTALRANSSAELVQVFLRSAFLLALGYLLAQWGESNLTQKRGLSLLHKVSRLSNPRFGIDSTIARVMELSREFFSGASCILVARRPRSRRWLLRTTGACKTVDEPVAAAAARVLMSMPEAKIVVYSKPLSRWLPTGGKFRAYDPVRQQWDDCAGQLGEQVAEQLDARSFISVPLIFRQGDGRVYVTSAIRAYTESDALFLCQIVAQVLPMIENIHLLDRMASFAALRERKMISRDLHDRTVQPYIGLSHSLSALRNKAAEGNPLKPDIDALAAMTAQVVSELRYFAGGFVRKSPAADQIITGALRLHALHAKQLYDIDMVLCITGEGRIGDRLAVAVVHLASEGISNICKHTAARHGALRIWCDDGWLHMEIENDSAEPAGNFRPASIAGRSAALGGTTRVEHRAPGLTIVHIEIPL